MRATRALPLVLAGCLFPMAIGCDTQTDEPSSEHADDPAAPPTRPSVYYRVRGGQGESGNDGVLVRRLNKSPTTCPEPGTTKAVCFVGEIDLDGLDLSKATRKQAEEAIAENRAIVRGRLRSELEPKTVLVAEEVWITTTPPEEENDGGPTFTGDLALGSGEVAYHVGTVGEKGLVANPLNKKAEDVLISTVDAGEDTDVALFAIENETGIVAVAPEVAEFDPVEATLLYLRADSPAAAE